MIVEMDYPVPLTPEELLVLADEAGSISGEIADLEWNLKSQVRSIRGEITDKKKELAGKLKMLRTKAEVKFTKLEVFYNSPEPGKKRICSAATGQEYEVTSMTEEELADLAVAADSPGEEEQQEELLPPEEQPRDVLLEVLRLKNGKYRAQETPGGASGEVGYSDHDTYEDAVGSLYVLTRTATDRFTWKDRVKGTCSIEKAWKLCEEEQAKKEK